MANQKLRIADVCKQKGMSIAELADKLNIKPNSLSMAIYRNSFSSDKLGEIADILGVTIPELYEDFDTALQKRMTDLLSGSWQNNGKSITITFQ